MMKNVSNREIVLECGHHQQQCSQEDECKGGDTSAPGRFTQRRGKSLVVDKGYDARDHAVCTASCRFAPS